MQNPQAPQVKRPAGIPSGEVLKNMAHSERQKVVNKYFDGQALPVLTDIYNPEEPFKVFALQARTKNKLRPKKHPWRAINATYRGADGQAVIKPLAYRDEDKAKRRMKGFRMGEDNLSISFPEELCDFRLQYGIIE